VGAAFGEMDARLAAFQHPATDRTHSWDLRIGANTVRCSKDNQPLERR
jgi:Ser/Thr protein kinase RdoA (MazF antagonist)